MITDHRVYLDDLPGHDIGRVVGRGALQAQPGAYPAMPSTQRVAQAPRRDPITAFGRGLRDRLMQCGRFQVLSPPPQTTPWIPLCLCGGSQVTSGLLGHTGQNRISPPSDTVRMVKSSSVTF